MKNHYWIIALASVIFGMATSCSEPQAKVNDEITVACYYFPNYHTRDTTDLPISRQHFDNWSEWGLLKQARPRFEGHNQPKVPAWGYTDEKDPLVMEQKISAAANNGIDVFIFDWYTYNERPFLNKCIDEGFLHAKNVDSIKFALMWANHDWQDLYPYTAGEDPDWLYSGAVTEEQFDRIGDQIIKNYFTKSNYWLIDGKAYFSIYDIQKFVEGFGSLEAARAAMNKLNDKAIEAGLKGVHWNLVAWGAPILPGQDAPKNTPELISKLGFSSATSYVWIHHAALDSQATDYNIVRDRYFAHWDNALTEYGVDYYPNVTMGWDSSPRTNQDKAWSGDLGYPYSNTMCNNTPENFKTALQMTKERLLKDPNGPRILNINCWNEWTEGSYLEPDTINGMSYLEAVKDVLN